MAKLGFSIRKNAAFLIWLLLCILAIIVPPVVIMILYSVDRNKPFLVTPWSAGEMLSYCGVLEQPSSPYLVSTGACARIDKLRSD